MTWINSYVSCQQHQRRDAYILETLGQSGNPWSIWKPLVNGQCLEPCERQNQGDHIRREKTGQRARPFGRLGRGAYCRIFRFFSSLNDDTSVTGVLVRSSCVRFFSSLKADTSVTFVPRRLSCIRFTSVTGVRSRWS